MKRFSEHITPLVYLLVILLIAQACTTTKSLKKDQLLYKETNINIKGTEYIDKVLLARKLNKQITPKPNDRLFGAIPLKLLIYNSFNDSLPEKGLRPWLKRKLAAPPVVYKPMYVDRSEKLLQEYLFNHGYFHNSVESHIETNKRKVSVYYNIRPNAQFLLDTIKFPKAKDTLTRYILQTKTKTVLTQGNPYSSEKLKSERERINQRLKNRGFYYFDPNYLIFKADTNSNKKLINLEIQVKENIPSKALKRYYINNVIIDSDYSLDKAQQKKDTIKHDSTIILYKQKYIKPKVLTNSVLFRPGNLYKYDNYINTLNKLSDLSIFKFTNINYKQLHTDSNLLNAKILLTRRKPKSLRFEIRAVTKSNNYIGPELSLNYRDRNVFNGSESFGLSLNSSFEAQYGSQKTYGNAFQLGVDADLSIPRVYFPIIDINKYLSDKYTPKTVLRAGYSYYLRTKLFNMNSLDFSYGYNWRQSKTKRHSFRSVNINYSKVSDRSATFKEIIENNELIAESFDEKLIFSLKYNFVYNNQLKKDQPKGMYFDFSADFAGHMLSLYNYFARGYFPNSQKQAKILGIKYSQYFRLTSDLRYYLKTGPESNIAMRLIGGVGKAYGNAKTLPFTKQFYIGGARDIRAFFAHGVGPGAYSPPDSLVNTYFDQVGDIKLEGNIEYRFNIISIVDGALFIDAGNIWLFKSNSKPKGVFHFDTFLDQVALGSGFGLRLDASVLVLRADLGIPLRKPWLAKKERWVIQDIDPSKSGWRNENLLLNIAIGYPF
ncbi:translocation and assembly module lipoprotein TamL [Salinivirga cyanobacteriivorans]